MPSSLLDRPRRRRLQSLVLPRDRADAGTPLPAVTGRILDASPHLLVITRSDVPARGGGGRELRLPMTTATTVWHGDDADMGALLPGRDVVVRLAPGGLSAERIWVGIARVTGIIVGRDRESMEVDMGPHRGRTHVWLPPRTLGQVMVRHPYLEVGFLVDVIAVAGSPGLLAVRPGTSQPGYRAADPPAPGAPPAQGPAARIVRGTATWHAMTAERGAAYPGLDSEGDAGGCPESPESPRSCVPLPYLSIGSDLQVQSECCERTRTLPVVECGCMAARFCDRCVTCGTSPRGRIIELTPLSFVELGGELEKGCFNVTLMMGV